MPNNTTKMKESDYSEHFEHELRTITGMPNAVLKKTMLAIESGIRIHWTYDNHINFDDTNRKAYAVVRVQNGTQNFLCYATMSYLETISTCYTPRHRVRFEHIATETNEQTCWDSLGTIVIKLC